MDEINKSSSPFTYKRIRKIVIFAKTAKLARLIIDKSKVKFDYSEAITHICKSGEHYFGDDSDETESEYEEKNELLKKLDLKKH